jgi:peroxiredoxin
LPHVIDLYQKHKDAGLEVLMISPEPSAQLKQYADLMKIPFPVLSDPRGEAHSSYGVTSIPFTLLIDRQGKVATALVGYSHSKFQNEFAPAVEEVVKS